MEHPASVDEDLIRRLPLPLAQQYRRAHNGKTALERHLAAYYLWEASLKLLASVAVVEFATLNDHDAELLERLRALARPTIGHWWEFVRRLTPVLADAGDPPFSALREFLLGRSRDDLPRAAGLDAALREMLEGQATTRATVRPMELYDRLVRYRNREVGHGAAGQRPHSHYERLGRALTLGVAEILGRLDSLAGRRLLYIPDVRRQASGAWLVERQELIGETARRIESLEVPESQAHLLPRPETLYVLLPRSGDDPHQQLTGMRCLHPLLSYNSDTNEVFFLNGRQGRQRAEYLCYSSGNVIRRDALQVEQQDLLSKLLGGSVDFAALEQWAERSVAEEPPTQQPEPPQSQRTLGEFELLSRIGRGGMGVVYRAWQPSLGRQVALKSLLRSGDPKAEARFAREIRALGRVEHPHLVKIFTSGALGDQWFYAMELIEGADLASVCDVLGGNPAAEIGAGQWQHAVSTAWQHARSKEETLSSAEAPNRPPPAEPPAPPEDSLALSHAAPRVSRSHVRHVVEIVRQVADAAHALHEVGIIHRDIKPGNIMLAPDGEHAVLMDLGLAQLADDAEGRLTRTRQFIGTLRYASPEQILAVGNLDRRTDVYSLGATLWELLTLKPLFGATEATPTPELMLRIQSTDPQRPSQLNPRIPADLDAIVGKCLEKDRARRYASAAELVADLDRFLAGDAVTARPIGQLDRTWRFLKRNPRVAILSATVLLLCVTLAAISTVAAISLAAARKDVEQQLGESLYQQARSAWLAHRLGWRVEALEAIARAARIHQTPALRDIAVQAIFDRDVNIEAELAVAAEITAAAYAPNGEQAAFAQGTAIYHWRREQGLWNNAAPRLFACDERVTHLRYSDDEHSLLGATSGGEVVMWDFRRKKLLFAVRAHSHAVQDLVFGPTDSTITSTDGTEVIVLDRVAGGKVDRAELVTIDRPAPAAPEPATREPSACDDERHVARMAQPGALEAQDFPRQHETRATALAVLIGKPIIVVVAAGQPVIQLRFDQNRFLESIVGSEFSDYGPPCIVLTADGRFLIAAINPAPYADAPPPEPAAPAPAPCDVSSVFRSTSMPLLAGHQQTGRHANAPTFDRNVRLKQVAWLQPAAVEAVENEQPIATQTPTTTAEYNSPFGGGLGDLGSLFSLSDESRPPTPQYSPYFDQGVTLARYDLENLEKFTHFTLPDMGTIRSIHRCGSGHDFLVAGSSGSVAIVHSRLASMSTTDQWKAVTSELGAALPTRERTRFLTVDSNQRLRIGRREGHDSHSWLRMSDTSVSQCIVPADKTYAWIANARRGISRFDSRTQEEKHLTSLEGIGSFASADDGRTMAVISKVHLPVLMVFDPSRNGAEEDLEIKRRGDPEKLGGKELSLSADGRWFALGGFRGPSHLWKREGAEFSYVRSFAPGKSTVRAIKFSPDGNRLAAAHLDRSVRLWNTASGELLGETVLADHPVGCFAFSPAGKDIACGSLGGRITLRDASDLSLVRSIGPKAETCALTFSDDALALAAGHLDGGISLFDVKSGERLAHWIGHAEPVTELAFDGTNHLITCDSTGTIRSWDLDELKAHLAELNLAW